AIAVAHTLAKRLAQGASERDQLRRWPVEEIEAYSQSGLWAINVPRAFGGAEVSYATLAEVIAIISAADPSLGQITQNHL
ncbi:acyl-CoA dehydrogenase family protein, partial [Acinetobacter baumannii]